MRVKLELEVDVVDPELLRDHVQTRGNDWGYTPTRIADMVYEALILNEPPGGPLAIGLEIVRSTAHIMEHVS